MDALAKFLPPLVLLVLLAGLLVLVFRRPGAASPGNLRSFGLGLLGWFVVHSIYWGIVTLVGSGMGPAAIIFLVCLFVPLPVNVAVLALLARRRPWLVLGAVAAFMLNAAAMFLVLPAADIDIVTPLFEILSMLPFYFRGLAL